MKTNKWALQAVVLTLMALASPRPAAAERSVQDRQAIRILQEGDRLRDQGRCEEAIDHYRAGMEVFPHWTFLLRIGDCYRLMDQHDRALPYLRRELRSVREDWNPQSAEAVEHVIEESMEEMLSRLAIESNIPEATVLIDGEVIGHAPVERELEPGDHIVEVRRARYVSRRQRVTTRHGETTYLVVELVRLDPVGDPLVRAILEETDDGAEAEARRRHRLWGGLMLGSGLALAGGGTSLFVLDGHEFTNDRRVSLDTMGPGMLLMALGVGLSIGGGLLFGLPPTDHSRRDTEEDDEDGTDDLDHERSGHRDADGEPMQ